MLTGCNNTSIANIVYSKDVHGKEFDHQDISILEISKGDDGFIYTLDGRTQPFSYDKCLEIIKKECIRRSNSNGKPYFEALITERSPGAWGCSKTFGQFGEVVSQRTMLFCKTLGLPAEECGCNQLKAHR